MKQNNTPLRILLIYFNLIGLIKKKDFIAFIVKTAGGFF